MENGKGSSSFQKGDSKGISNYRPVANLCAASKVFENLILLRIKKLEKVNNVDITNKGQHGFKTGKSTNTAGLLVRSLIARALDEDNYALLASIDLSSAFDVVNVKLLYDKMVTFKIKMKSLFLNVR